MFGELKMFGLNKNKSIKEKSSEEILDLVMNKAKLMSEKCVLDYKLISKYLCLLPYDYFISMNEKQEKEFIDKMIIYSCNIEDKNINMIEYCMDIYNQNKQSKPIFNMIDSFNDDNPLFIKKSEIELNSDLALKITNNAITLDEVIVNAIKFLDESGEFSEIKINDNNVLREPTNMGQMFIDLCVAYYNLKMGDKNAKK